jgi:hypothetical protein
MSQNLPGQFFHIAPGCERDHAESPGHGFHHGERLPPNRSG